DQQGGGPHGQPHARAAADPPHAAVDGARAAGPDAPLPARAGEADAPAAGRPAAAGPIPLPPDGVLPAPPDGPFGAAESDPSTDAEGQRTTAHQGDQAQDSAPYADPARDGNALPDGDGTGQPDAAAYGPDGARHGGSAASTGDLAVPEPAATDPAAVQATAATGAESATPAESAGHPGTDRPEAGGTAADGTETGSVTDGSADDDITAADRVETEHTETDRVAVAGTGVDHHDARHTAVDGATDGAAEGAAAVPAVDPHTEHPLASYVLRVNGTDRPVTGAWIGESLLYVLRERLGLAGAKDGCSQGECGACSVQVDGRLVASCLVPAATTAGAEVRTVEGLSADGQPCDVQRALAASGAVQCGFCVPGLAMTVHDLLEGNHAPNEQQTRQAICGNLCRCSGYRGVLDAVRDVVAGREAAAAAEEAAAHEGAQAPAPTAGPVHHQALHPQAPSHDGPQNPPHEPPHPGVPHQAEAPDPAAYQGGPDPYQSGYPGHGAPQGDPGGYGGDPLGSGYPGYGTEGQGIGYGDGPVHDDGGSGRQSG
ncbi:2Fe-2S iron-sulfur cluster-binding protein, partial [Streptomyces sp. 796.1]|uniref:2Fe-2S iron-sulfur cluster-binding protein n=1 Tax=Streptomyces sp. 796.1 TaxID=3163029 RepID=UPI0039C9A785